MSIIDITMRVAPGMATYPGDPEMSVTRVSSMEAGASANVSRITMGSHTGTHVDPPLHFIPGGMGVDALKLGTLIGQALVIETAAREVGRAELVAAGFEPAHRLLIKTHSSGAHASGVFDKDFAHLTKDGADFLIGSGVRLVGIDSLSVERFRSPGHEVHKALLGAGVVVVEGLDLTGAGPGRYELICLPLRLAGGDGAPARAVLRTLEGGP